MVEAGVVGTLRSRFSLPDEQDCQSNEKRMKQAT
jgi:hypothetical protein